MIDEAVRQLESQWSDERWSGIERTYTAEQVVKLRGSVVPEHTVARLGAERLWELLQREEPVRALGALTGGQAVQMVRAGLEAIYLSGWQVAADANLAGSTYPDQSLYPVNSVPSLVKRLNNALLRADQIDWAEDRNGTHWLAPIVADAEAGFGGPLNAFELMKSMIEAGAAGVHYEDQLSSEKKCGHLGGKVLVPTQQFVRTLNAARLAADVCGVPTVLVARTDALSAALLTSDVDEYDRDFVTGERTAEGFFRIRDGIEAAIARGLAYAPYADLVWFETSTPDLGEAKEFAEAMHEKFPGKLLAYNCSPSFNWRKHLDDDQIASFQEQLNEWGYRFQFITLAGFHSVNAAMFELARGYADGAHARVRAAAGAGVRDGGVRLHRDAPPARGRRRLLRPRHAGRLARQRDARAQGLDRGGAVREGARARVSVAEETLSREGLAFVERLHRELNPRRLELLEARQERQLRLDAGENPGFLAETRDDPRRRLARCARAARPRRPPLRDHRAGRPEDDDQRAQLGRARLHGRLRGRELADVGERRPRPRERPRRDRRRALARDAGEERTA